ncbi:MAG: YidC/Oxa1 family membrane protein insertase, partial [Planctomycetes bacterium]|nr:YidC/Oxa1 family membrane protein insertase [Planctomycetota bacterium]
EPYLPAFVADPARGWLGPYLNVLPIMTVGLFLVHQKLFMPPATDENTRMQQQVMKVMMIFMGVMFFKVPAGLCIYFIVSSLWGIFERTVLLPNTPRPGAADKPPLTKKEMKEKPSESKPKKLPFGLGGNGASKPLSPKERRKKQRQKRR